MNWVKLLAVAAVTAALIAAPATAHADPVPTNDEVLAILAKMADPHIPAASKADVVSPGFAPDEAGTIDNHLDRMDAFGGLLPPDFTVTDIQPAPNNFAGATIETNGPGPIYTQTAPRPIVLVDQHGHWLITHDSATQILDTFWRHANRRHVFVP